MTIFLTRFGLFTEKPGSPGSNRLWVVKFSPSYFVFPCLKEKYYFLHNGTIGCHSESAAEVTLVSDSVLTAHLRALVAVVPAVVKAVASPVGHDAPTIVAVKQVTVTLVPCGHWSITLYTYAVLSGKDYEVIIKKD